MEALRTPATASTLVYDDGRPYTARQAALNEKLGKALAGGVGYRLSDKELVVLRDLADAYRQRGYEAGYDDGRHDEAE